MQISDEQVKRFQTLWEQKFGQLISKEEAYKQGSRLVCLMELICKPTTKN